MAERLLSEVVSVIAAFDPSSSATTVATDAFDMKKWEKVMGILLVGAFATSGTLDAKFVESATSNGTFTTHVASKSITQLTDADLNKQVIVNLSAAEVQAVTMRWAKLKMTNSSTQKLAAVVIGVGHYTEAFTTIAYSDLSSVDEIVK